MIRIPSFNRPLVSLLLILALGACSEVKEKAPEPVEKDAGQQLSEAIKLKADESSAKQLANDSEENELVQLIKDNADKIQQLNITLKVAQKTNNHDVVSTTEAEIQQVKINTETEIAKYYKIVRVPFIHINNRKLLPESQAVLEAKQAELCNPAYKTIVYGYGGYIGSEAATKTISLLRAQAVAKWLKANTSCETLTRGLGIDIRAREIQDIQLPETEQNTILEESRHVRIYTHL